MYTAQESDTATNKNIIFWDLAENASGGTSGPPGEVILDCVRSGQLGPHRGQNCSNGLRSRQRNLVADHLCSPQM